MKRNLALSILFVSLTAAMGMAQKDPKALAEKVYLDGLASVAEADFFDSNTAGINACSTRCGLEQFWNCPSTQVNYLPTSQATAPAKTTSARPGQTANAAQTGEHAAAASSNDLNAVLAQMNQTSAGFKSAQGDFEFETYQKLVDEKDTQKGRIYFRKNKAGVDAAFDIEGHAPKQVVYTDGKLRIFEKKINQVTERAVGKNKSDVEAFLSLGFGASGAELQRDYDVKLDGWEAVDGVQTAKLDLTPKNPKLLQTYNKIILWIDPEHDVLLKQQFFERSGDYRLAHYSNMKLNQKVSDDVFHLKTNGNTKTVTPQ